MSGFRNYTSIKMQTVTNMIKYMNIYNHNVIKRVCVEFHSNMTFSPAVEIPSSSSSECSSHVKYVLFPAKYKNNTMTEAFRINGVDRGTIKSTLWTQKPTKA